MSRGAEPAGIFAAMRVPRGSLAARASDKVVWRTATVSAGRAASGRERRRAGGRRRSAHTNTLRDRAEWSGVDQGPGSGTA
jgi:hypothetical protein